MPPVKKPEAPKYVPVYFPKHIYTRSVDGTVLTMTVKDEAELAAQVAKGAVESPADLPPGQDLDPDDVNAALSARDARIAQLEAALLATQKAPEPPPADSGKSKK